MLGGLAAPGLAAPSAASTIWLTCCCAAPAEVASALRYLNAADAGQDKAKNQLTRWERLAQALLGCNEFEYLD